jgi:UDP-2,3-diacylglucosamine hydrolase
MEKKNIYFVSDLHLGIPDHASSLEREKLLVRWLDTIMPHTEALFLMGDLFDFWFEYTTVVPKGFVRFLGKLAQFTDAGIPVHLFRGNHDLWAFDYLEKEIGVQLHRKPAIWEMQGKNFYLAHGDGLGPGDYQYKILKRIFEFRPNQLLFRWLHPDLGARLGNYFSRRSRLSKLAYAHQPDVMFDKEKEMLFHYAQQKAVVHPEVDFFVFGHRHIPLQMLINKKASLLILGDWISHLTYGVFAKGEMKIESYQS